MPPILISASVLRSLRANPDRGARRRTGLLLNPHYATPPALEELFLDHTFRWLRIGGVLVLVIPFERFRTCVDVLSAHFTDVKPYLLADPESQRFGQIAVFATRKRVTGSTVRDSRQALLNYCKGYLDMPTLGGATTSKLKRTP